MEFSGKEAETERRYFVSWEVVSIPKGKGGSNGSLLLRKLLLCSVSGYGDYSKRTSLHSMWL